MVNVTSKQTANINEYNAIKQSQNPGWVAITDQGLFDARMSEFESVMLVPERDAVTAAKRAKLPAKSLAIVEAKEAEVELKKQEVALVIDAEAQKVEKGVVEEEVKPLPLTTRIMNQVRNMLGME